MKQSLKITRNEDKVTITQQGDFTVEEAVALSFELFARVIMSSKEPIQDNLEARKAMYDIIVTGVSSLVHEVYPEIEEDLNKQQGTPEDFLAHLEQMSEDIDKKLEKLKKLEGSEQDVEVSG